MPAKMALEGLKVADFSWILAGPGATRCLSMHGALVVKVESMTRLDTFRTYVPMAGGIFGINRGGGFDGHNHDKYGIQLNLNTPRGRELAQRLVQWADVVVENFTPGTMGKWGLGYEDIKKIKPDIIMVSLTLQGQSGPDAFRAGFGVELQSLAGFTHLIGWPDRVPVGTGIAYSDYICPFFAVSAIMAALDYREKTGKGQYIDISHLETCATFLSTAILDYSTNGRLQPLRGNRSSWAAPHGVYRSQGEDRWCAIAVFTDQEWQSFINVLGNPPWTSEVRFATFQGRKQNEDEMDRLIEEWTVNYPAEEIMARMQNGGVAAGIVALGEDLNADPQLKHRNHYKVLDHEEIGPHAYEMPSWRLSKTPGDIRMPSPCLGEHTAYVATEILGMSDEEIVECLENGVFE